tara:strand:- start:6444 stop:7760 length:1317 start_codon:yes stop_codon:yes gene_type:complete
MLFLRFVRTNCPQAADLRGWILFLLGIFFLPSSVLIGGILLFFALIFGSFKPFLAFKKDKFNYFFLFTALLMIVGSIRSYSGWLAWIGLANWLPMFWAFWGFQAYLTTSIARRIVAIFLLFGTIPVVFTGLGQMWFGFQGPWEIFNGLIIWHIAIGGEPYGRLSGLFDYANIAGTWLAVVWPFSLAALSQKPQISLRNFIFFAFAVFIAISIALTDSRNAWGGLLLAVPWVFGPFTWKWLLPLLFIFLLPIIFAVLPWAPSQLQLFSRQLVPDSLWTRLNDMQYEGRSLQSTRLNQWRVAFKLISERPLLGWGAAAFSVLYPLRAGLWHGHAHNLPIELAVSNGLLVSILITFATLYLLIRTFRIIIYPLKSKSSQQQSISIFDRAWWSSSLILVFMHGTDIPLFDSRINIIGWILLSGLRVISFSESKNLLTSKVNN